VLLGAAAAALAGARLHRIELPVGAPVAAGILLVGAWRDEASRAYVQVVLTAGVLLLVALAVATARLLARGAAGEAIFRALVALAGGVVVLALVLTWWGETPEALLSALFGLIGATFVLYLAIPLIARLDR
jgi:hypothetical protein